MEFQSWAQENGAQNRRCKVCALPPDLLAQLIAARDAGYGSVLLSRFLVDQGHRVSVSSLENHFKRGGH